mmetsp:Transcript_37109/g.102414  ORF Transcript_37109/g.102414 Transcript_37109/m.102414 type:complete len:239 (-) Transcript_37109:66-782(-)
MGVERVRTHHLIEEVRRAHLGVEPLLLHRRRRHRRRRRRRLVRRPAARRRRGALLLVLVADRVLLQVAQRRRDDVAVDLGVGSLLAPLRAARGEDGGQVGVPATIGQLDHLEAGGRDAHVVEEVLDDALELLRVVLGAADDKDTQRAVVPLLVLAEDDREEQEQAAVVHDPPEVDRSRVADSRRPVLVALGEHEGHVERVGRLENLDHALGARDVLLPRRGPRGHHRVGAEAAEPGRL